MKNLLIAIIVILFSIAPSIYSKESITTDWIVDDHSKIQVTKNLTSMPLSFTENQGQWPDSVRFRADAGGATMWFSPDGAFYQFTRAIESATTLILDKQNDMVDELLERQPGSGETMMIKANFVGANPNPQIVGVNMMEYKCNYFIGSDSNNWHTDVPNYTAVMYQEIYEGIDLKYYGNGKQMEYDFIVSPHADFSQIKIQYEGAESIAINDKGELVVTTMWGEVVEQCPVIYQIENNIRRTIDGKYSLQEDNSFSFALNDYNPLLSLVIDPVLSYSTFLGGELSDGGYGIAVDASGAVYVTGGTKSTDFPTFNPYQGTHQGGGYKSATFVTKISPSGNSLVYSTYLSGDSTSPGGYGDDRGQSIAVDASGAAYVVGQTSFTDFPTVNAYQGEYGRGYEDAFVVKLSPSGNSLVYSTYLGGTGYDSGYDIAVDAFGAAHVTGQTNSTRTSALPQTTGFPLLNPYQGYTDNARSSDAFVTKLSPSGSTLLYSTFLGGEERDYGNGIAIDDSGAAYVTGQTKSTDFPTLNAYQGEYQGGYSDAFVTKLSPSGSSLVYSTYLGGGGDAADQDWGNGIAVDDSGAAYVTGGTYSTEFPTLNAYQGEYQGGHTDAFVTKLCSSGDSLVYSTYLGGGESDGGYDIAVDTSGAAYVTGNTSSSDFPTLNPYQTDQVGSDAFVTKLSSSGSSLVYSTYLGGGDTAGYENDEDCGWGIAVDVFGAAYVAGSTKSTDFPTLNAYQGEYQGGYGDVFVTKFSPPKTLVIKDSDDELMANTEFELIKISNDIPDLTEDTLGTFTTDNDGVFTFESDVNGEITFEGNTLLVGDTLKVALNVHSQDASKHTGVLGTKYSIHLDNAKFNFDGSIKFMEIDNSAKQEVIMDHTEFRYNLLVSVEWDASLDYLSDLQASFTYMSNYLYDVSDGQIRLDTIAVYDNKEYWDQADIWIRASNIAHPNAHVWGINGNAAIAGRIQMPRRWFGNEDACRNESFTEDPLDLTHSTVYRTICHEFGHYGLGFYDEYLFAFGSHCAEINNYGFMQYQYDGGGINSTEMSNSFRYASANCGNTEQYMNNLLLSCWGYFENMFEKEYGASNLSVPIIKPEERDSLPTWPNDTKCYAGPNDNIYAPDYNVGELIVFPVNPENPSADVNTVEIEIRDILGGAPLSKSIVYTYKQEMGVTIDIVKQGATSDMGKIRALGVNSDDLVVAFGIVDTIGIAKSANSARSIWLCGEATSGKSGNSRLGNKFSSSSFNESMVIELNRVNGNFPMIFDLSLNESTIDYSMITQTSFGENPTLMVLPDNGSLLNYSFNTSNGGYETTIADDCGKEGMATVWAKDNSSTNFFINTDYICYEPDTTLDHYKVVASDGRMELVYKNTSTGAKSAVSSLNGIEKIAILTSPYPILSNGLGENFTQAGNTYSIATYPVDLPDEGNLITIRYAESDLIIGNDQMGIESSLSIHQWNVGNGSWEPIGGTVDTALNEVFTIISDAGIYAAFTTDIMTGIGDDEHGSIIPDQFQLSQNYPNPFNPTTMIEYNVPTRSDVSIEIFNIVGQKIKSLVNETKMAGRYEVIWDGNDSNGNKISSGIYFYRFETDNFIETKKMLLLK